jgi:hypothetical protein
LGGRPGLGFASHRQTESKQTGKKMNARQRQFLSEEDTPAGPYKDGRSGLSGLPDPKTRTVQQVQGWFWGWQYRLLKKGK